MTSATSNSRPKNASLHLHGFWCFWTAKLPRGRHSLNRDMNTTINNAPEMSLYLYSRPSVPVLGDKIRERYCTFLVKNVLPAWPPFEIGMKVSSGESCIIEVRWLLHRSHHRILTHKTPPVGGEVPQLIAVHGKTDASGK
jgi:hypothetical protein